MLCPGILVVLTGREASVFTFGDETGLSDSIGNHRALPTHLTDEERTERVDVLCGLLSFPHVLHES